MSAQTFAVKIVSDVPFAARDERQLLADLYLPESAGERPAVIWLHGGGWRFGDRKLAPDLETLAETLGFVFVSIEYTLSRQATFPAALEDVKTAVRWLKSAALAYGIDPDRIALWGGSSGGHLAALCATSGGGIFDGIGFNEQSSYVAAVVDCYGPVDFAQLDAHRDPEGKASDDAESVQLPKGKLSKDADSLESLFMGAPISTVPDQVQTANPIRYLRGQRLPPFLILHGLADTAVPAHQSQILYQALRANGTDATLVQIGGLGHGFTNRKRLDDNSWPVEIRDWAGSTHQQVKIFELIGHWLRQKLTPNP